MRDPVSQDDVLSKLWGVSQPTPVSIGMLGEGGVDDVTEIFVRSELCRTTIRAMQRSSESRKITALS